MTDQGSSITVELLHAYHDGEVDEEQRSRIEAALAGDAQLRAELESLSFMAQALERRLDDEAAHVPDARFEQIWDDIEQGLERGDRLQEAAEREASIWSRLATWLRPARIPLAVAGAAAVLAVVLLRTGDDGANDGGVASVPTQDAPAPAPEATPGGETGTATPQTQLAQAPQDEPELEPDSFPAPESNEADIERIDFGGKTGRIERIESGKSRGTTTVIWFTDEDDADSERSL